MPEKEWGAGVNVEEKGSLFSFNNTAEVRQHPRVVS